MLGAAGRRRAPARRTSVVAARRRRSPRRRTIATICCASTSSGLRGTRVSSIAPSLMRCATTARLEQVAAELREDAALRRPPTWWPARPMRWSPRATDVGDSTWITRSTAPMSIPSSSDEVATIAGQVALLQRSSTSTRARARASRGVRARSPLGELVQARARRSARRRLLTKMIVERCARTSSSSSGGSPARSSALVDLRAGSLDRSVESTCRARPCPRPGRPPEVQLLAVPGVDDRHGLGRVPPTEEPCDLLERALRRREADPLRSASPTSRSRRSRHSARCAPRFVPAIAWISSMMTDLDAAQGLAGA